MNRNADTTRKVNNMSEGMLPKVSRFERPVAIITYPGNRIIVSDSVGRLLVYDKDANYELN